MTEKQNVAVGVLQFESAQAVMGIFERFEKLDMARRELCRQQVRIGDMEVGVPAGDALLDVSCVVRHWIDADGLEHDHRTAALDNAEEDVVRFGSLKRNVEPEKVAIKRQRGRNIIHNEERRNTRDFWFSHMSLSPRIFRQDGNRTGRAVRSGLRSAAERTREWRRTPHKVKQAV